jgi:hypothetical protein
MGLVHSRLKGSIAVARQNRNRSRSDYRQVESAVPVEICSRETDWRSDKKIACGLERSIAVPEENRDTAGQNVRHSQVSDSIPVEVAHNVTTGRLTNQEFPPSNK